MKFIRWILIGATISCLVILLPILFGTRPLSEAELALARPIFGKSIRYEKVRVNIGGPLTWIYPGVTTGNTISFPRDSYNQTRQKDQALLLHELTHVWQFQHHGISYLPRAVWEEVTQSDAYTVHFDADKNFQEYDVEEQGEIVAEYFLTGEERYAPYIGELKISQ